MTTKKEFWLGKSQAIIFLSLILVSTCLEASLEGGNKVKKRGLHFGYGSSLNHPQLSFNYEKDFPLGKPFVLSTNYHQQHQHQFQQHEGGDLGGEVNLEFKNYAPNFMFGGWKQEEASEGVQQVQQDFSQAQNLHLHSIQHQGLINKIPLSVDLPFVSPPSPVVAHPGPVRTINDYSQSQSSQSLPQDLPSLSLPQDFHLQSQLLNIKDVPSFDPLRKGNSYEVVDENADKVPDAPPRPRQGSRQLNQPQISVATSVLPPGQRIGPVTFNQQQGGSIGSGGLGVTKLPNGGLVLGSGSYGYTQDQQQQNQQQGQQLFEAQGQSLELQQLQQQLQQQIQQQLIPQFNENKVLFLNPDFSTQPQVFPNNQGQAQQQQQQQQQQQPLSFSQSNLLSLQAQSLNQQQSQQQQQPIFQGFDSSSNFKQSSPSFSSSSSPPSFSSSSSPLLQGGFVPSFDQNSFQLQGEHF